MELSEVFWTFFITSTIGLIVAIGRMCYKSKCKEVSFCCLKVIRDVEIEQSEDEKSMALKRMPSESNV